MFLNSDLKVVAKNSFSKMLLTMFCDPGYSAVRRYRLAHTLYKRFNLRVWPRLLCYWNQIDYSVDIDYRADIGEAFQIYHATAGGVAIGCNVKIGNNVSVHQGVTIGGNGEKKRLLDNGELITQPIIEDNVQIMTGVTIIGPVIIGANCIIGAGSVILKDIPRDSVVFSKSEIIVKKRKI